MTSTCSESFKMISLCLLAAKLLGRLDLWKNKPVFGQFRLKIQSKTVETWMTYSWFDQWPQWREESEEWNFQKSRLRYESIPKCFLPTFFEAKIRNRTKTKQPRQRGGAIWRKSLTFSLFSFEIRSWVHRHEINSLCFDHRLQAAAVYALIGWQTWKFLLLYNGTVSHKVL